MARQRGISLVELMIAMALASAVGLLIMGMFVTSNRTFVDQNQILDVQRSGRIALESITRSLRQAGLDPLGTANAGVEVATATTVRATMDLNLDEDVDSGERVTFRWAGNVLQKGVGPVGAETWQNLAENVSAFRVDYFGDNNDPIAAPVTTAAGLASIRSLIVTMTIREDRASGGSFERTYSTGICCRNLFR